MPVDLFSHLSIFSFCEISIANHLTSVYPIGSSFGTSSRNSISSRPSDSKEIKDSGIANEYFGLQWIRL